MAKHQRIIFNGNGYSEEWVKEAARRGLPNIQTMVEAASALTTEKAVALFEKFHIFTRAELEAREEVQYETYAKTINIEALTMIDMTKKQILPAVMKYTKSMADTVLAVTEAGADASVQRDMLNEVSEKLVETKRALEALEVDARTALDILRRESKQMLTKEQCRDLAFFYKENVVPKMAALRKPVDELEMLVAKEMWPMPSYGDLLFEV